MNKQTENVGEGDLKTYECMGCGRIQEANFHPMTCSECGGIFHDRARPLE